MTEPNSVPVWSQRCANCYHSREHRKLFNEYGEQLNTDTIECRFQPPNNMAVWPLVDKNEWCGQWKAMEG
jgi:hypothetical protein